MCNFRLLIKIILFDAFLDEVLLNHIDKEEVLRTVFRKARRKAKEELNDSLAEFRNKRTMGENFLNFKSTYMFYISLCLR